MKVYDTNDNLLAEDTEDFELDATRGYLFEDALLLAEHEAVEYQPEIRDTRPEAAIVLQEYYERDENGEPKLDEDGNFIVGGQDIMYPLLQAEILAQDAWNEYEDIFRYIEYTPAEIRDIEITTLNAEINSYAAISVEIAMGAASPEDYPEEIAAVKAARARIRELEAEAAAETEAEEAEVK